MSFTEGLQLVITFLAAIAAVSSAISAVKSWSAAEKANELATTALQLSLHDHKVKIMPDLSASIDIQIYLDQPDEELFEVTLQNNSHSLCTITKIFWNTVYFQLDTVHDEVKLNYPIKLQLGNSVVIELTFYGNNRREQLLQ